VRIVVTGAGGMLARAIAAEARSRGHDVLPLDRASLDTTDERAVRAVLTQAGPDAVIQCAAYTRVDDAEADEGSAHRVNAGGAAIVARAAADVGARLVYPGTDYVFDGRASVPYPPDAPALPVNAYGRSKLAGEGAVLAAADALVVRTSWLYGPGGRSFVRTILARARAGAPLRVVDDQRGSPTASPDLAVMILALLEARAPTGTYHATNRGETTWYGLACAALELAGIQADVTPCTSAESPQVASRPAYSVLDCSATYAITGQAPEWREGLSRTLQLGFD
jgi:dTDP-4-dehydrorhamnose reductase